MRHLDLAAGIAAPQLGRRWRPRSRPMSRGARRSSERLTRDSSSRSSISSDMRTRAGPDPVEVVAALVVQAVRAVAEQGLAEAVDGPQRRAQVVGDGVGERLQLLHRLRQLRGALADALLELGVQRADLLVRGAALRHVVGDGGEPAQRAAAVAQRGQGDVGPEARAVLADPPSLLAEVAVAGGHGQRLLRRRGRGRRRDGSGRWGGRGSPPRGSR